MSVAGRVHMSSRLSGVGSVGDIGNRFYYFFFSSRRRHTRLQGDWSSDVCSSDLLLLAGPDDGALAPFLNQAAALGLASRVTCVGHVSGDRACRAWGAADAFILPKIGRASCRERV